jgi:hypothetical protein
MSEGMLRLLPQGGKSVEMLTVWAPYCSPGRLSLVVGMLAKLVQCCLAGFYCPSKHLPWFEKEAKKRMASPAALLGIRLFTDKVFRKKLH